MKYLIGIDGGGTKTAFLCYDEANRLVGRETLPSCHVLQVEAADAVSILKTGITRLITKIPERDAQIYICAGLAGYGKNIVLRKRIEEICSMSFAPYSYLIKSDADIALAGALGGQDGILVIAGTGSIALAKNQGQIARCGGWGCLFGDEASAYAMGIQLLKAYTKQCDGRMPETALKNFVKEKCGLSDDYDMITYVAEALGNRRDGIAKLAMLVYALAEQKEPCALEIYKNAAQEIASMICTLAKGFSGRVKASYAGGVWNAKALLIDTVKACLSENVDLQAPEFDPEYGACILARKQFL